jgi:hypothetical protein
LTFPIVTVQRLLEGLSATVDASTVRTRKVSLSAF